MFLLQRRKVTNASEIEVVTASAKRDERRKFQHEKKWDIRCKRGRMTKRDSGVRDEECTLEFFFDIQFDFRNSFRFSFELETFHVFCGCVSFSNFQIIIHRMIHLFVFFSFFFLCFHNLNSPFFLHTNKKLSFSRYSISLIELIGFRWAQTAAQMSMWSDDTQHKFFFTHKHWKTYTQRSFRVFFFFFILLGFNQKFSIFFFFCDNGIFATLFFTFLYKNPFRFYHKSIDDYLLYQWKSNFLQKKKMNEKKNWIEITKKRNENKMTGKLANCAILFDTMRFVSLKIHHWRMCRFNQTSSTTSGKKNYCAQTHTRIHIQMYKMPSRNISWTYCVRDSWTVKCRWENMTVFAHLLSWVKNLVQKRQSEENNQNWFPCSRKMVKNKRKLVFTFKITLLLLFFIILFWK